RASLDQAVQQGALKDIVADILPSGTAKRSYPRMEDFVTAHPEATIKAFVVVDLFLRAANETPSAVFHQLMYSMFPSPTDDSIVCGRIGILKALTSHYKSAHFELFTYVPTYLETQNEPVGDSHCKYLYPEGADQHTLRRFVADHLNAVKEVVRTRLPDELRA